MTRKPEIVFNGYLRLNAAERSELVNAINEYVKSETEKQNSIMQENFSHVAKMDIGPMGGSCPCCGR